MVLKIFHPSCKTYLLPVSTHPQNLKFLHVKNAYLEGQSIFILLNKNYTILRAISAIASKKCEEEEEDEVLLFI